MQRLRLGRPMLEMRTQRERNGENRLRTATGFLP